jgi:hypothetical protein
MVKNNGFYFLPLIKNWEMIKKMDIKEVENQFIITIEKSQLNADYILNLINWLQFVSVEPNELKSYLTKIQQIPPKKTVSKKSKKRIWDYSGSINLNHKLDNINLRDFAYE